MSIENTKKAIEKRQKEQSEGVELIATLKEKIVKEVEKDNPEKTQQLVNLWIKKKEELANTNDDKATTIGYKVGSTISNVVSGFKKGLNKS